jgi:arsenate reductase (thioredoxin)
MIPKAQPATRKVLFLCAGNSCRSQMAEAIVNARYSKAWRAFSAGVRPAGYVHPKTIQVLKEIGIDHQGESKSADRFRNEDFELVVTVCDEAAEECPIWLGKGRRVHVGYRDPSEVEGSDEERLLAFREVRDEMLNQIPALLKEFEANDDQIKRSPSTETESTR